MLPTDAVHRRPPVTTVLLAAALVTAGALLGAAPPAVAAERERPVPYLAPVPGEVLRGFEAPGSPYGPGHRGVDLAARPGAAVRAAGPGVVVHAGQVAGTPWVSIDHPDGIRTAYGPLARVTVTSGRQVASGDALGTLAAGGHGHGDRDAGLHLSARRGGAYLDPLALFGGVARPSLVGPGSRWPDAAPAGRARAVGGPGGRVPASPAAGVGDRMARPGPPVPGPAPTGAGARWTP